MLSNENNLLIDHLDKTLGGDELSAIEQLIRNDESVANEWQWLQFTAANIREAGLYDQVTAVRNQYTADKGKVSEERTKGGIVRTMSQRMMRVAAVLLFVCISATLYKYISVNDSGVYNKYYSSYDLPTSRSGGNQELLDNAYRNNKWAEVITLVNRVKDKSSKHFFLAGIANLELKQYPKAIQSFESVMTKNSASDDDYFGEEAEYYLAMSYLANKEANKALPIIEKIKKDKSHLFNETVNKMGLDFKILQLKEGK
jgi:tetratricopeptide (TPR) repeat protein